VMVITQWPQDILEIENVLCSMVSPPRFSRYGKNYVF
jgi:hypothetical protein